MMTPAYFQTLASYNTWANGRLYAAVAELPEAEIAAARPAAYFDSLLGTLNHIVVGDRVWMGRFEQVDPGIPSLDKLLYPEFGALRTAREAEDRRIEAHTGGLSAADLGGELAFRTMTQPRDVTMPRWQALAHFFNHQTHHRGQAHALLKDAGMAEPPALDLVFYLR